MPHSRALTLNSQWQISHAALELKVLQVSCANLTLLTLARVLFSRPQEGQNHSTSGPQHFKATTQAGSTKLQSHDQISKATARQGHISGRIDYHCEAVRHLSSPCLDVPGHLPVCVGPVEGLQGRSQAPLHMVAARDARSMSEAHDVYASLCPAQEPPPICQEARLVWPMSRGTAYLPCGNGTFKASSRRRHRSSHNSRRRSSQETRHRSNHGVWDSP